MNLQVDPSGKTTLSIVRTGFPSASTTGTRVKPAGAALLSAIVGGISTGLLHFPLPRPLPRPLPPPSASPGPIGGVVSAGSPGTTAASSGFFPRPRPLTLLRTRTAPPSDPSTIPSSPTVVSVGALS